MVELAERGLRVAAKGEVSMVAVPEGWVVRVVMKAARVGQAAATGEVVELEVMAAAKAVGGMWGAWVAAKVGRAGLVVATVEVGRAEKVAARVGRAGLVAVTEEEAKVATMAAMKAAAEETEARVAAKVEVEMVVVREGYTATAVVKVGRAGLAVVTAEMVELVAMAAAMAAGASLVALVAAMVERAGLAEATVEVAREAAMAEIVEETEAKVVAKAAGWMVVTSGGLVVRVVAKVERVGLAAVTVVVVG